MYHTKIQQKIRDRRILHDVTLELTYRCNLDCFYCYNDVAKQGKSLTLDNYRVLLEDLAAMQTLNLMLTGGEPMIHPDFFAIGRIARELGFLVKVRTNGHSLTKTNCARLLSEVQPYMVEVSLHGATARVHDRQTRVKGSFELLVKNIAIAKQAGLRVSVVCTPTAWNEGQIEDMFVLCDGLNVPLRFQGPVAPKDNGDITPLKIQPKPDTWKKVEALLSKRKALSKVALGSGKQLIGQTIDLEEQELMATCSVGVAGVDIDPFGNVQACMHLQESAGNIHEKSIEDIWNNSPLFKRARDLAISAALQFQDKPFEQLGAPIYCLAVEENCNKGCQNCSA